LEEGNQFDYIEFPPIVATVEEPGVDAYTREDCGLGKLLTATKEEWLVGEEPISEADAAAILAVPVRINGYLDDEATTAAAPVPACTQVSFFANETWLADYLPTVLTPAQIQALDDADAGRSEYMSAVCDVVNARAGDVTTVTATNRAESLTVTDKQFCGRWVQCRRHADVAFLTHTKKICACPFDLFGLTCRVRKPISCAAVLVSPTAAQLSCDAANAAPASPHWRRFGNDYDPTFFGPPPCNSFSVSTPEATRAPGVDAAGVFTVTSSPRCEYALTERFPVEQGVLPSLWFILDLEGYSWDTNYNFTYNVFRPADASPEASEASRDTAGAIPPLFTVSAARDTAGEPVPEKPARTYALSLRAVNMNRLSDNSQDHRLELPASVLAAIEPVTAAPLTLSLPGIVAADRGFTAGGRIMIQATIAVSDIAGESNSAAVIPATPGAKTVIMFEDYDYQPGGPREAPFSETNKWIVISVCVGVAVLLIIAIRVFLSHRENRYFAQARQKAAAEAAEEMDKQTRAARGGRAGAAIVGSGNGGLASVAEGEDGAEMSSAAATPSAREARARRVLASTSSQQEQDQGGQQQLQVQSFSRGASGATPRPTPRATPAGAAQQPLGSGTLSFTNASIN